MRCMLSLIKPDKGDIQLFGKNLQQDRASILARVGCLIENLIFINSYRPIGI